MHIQRNAMHCVHRNITEYWGGILAVSLGTDSLVGLPMIMQQLFNIVRNEIESKPAVRFYKLNLFQ